MRSVGLFILMIVLGVNYLNAQDNIVDDSDKDHVFTKIEMGAHYPGGASAWAKFLKANLKNISSADTAVKVEVTFVVDKYGAVKDITSKGGSRELRMEAERLIKISGKWSHANACGRSVSAYKTVTILFPPKNK